MRDDAGALFNQMPDKEKKYLSYAPYPLLIDKLSNLVPVDERILGLASSFLVGGVGENGILSYTPQRLVFGSTGPGGGGGGTPQWKVWKWPQIRGASSTHPFFGAVELIVTTEDGTVKFHVGQNKSDCKDWAGAMCKGISSYVEREQFG